MMINNIYNISLSIPKEEIFQADETILQMLRESGRSATSKSYMWLYRNGRGRPLNILLDYQRMRASKHPEMFLSGFKGYLFNAKSK